MKISLIIDNMRRRYMNTNSSLGNDGSVLPVVLWRSKKAGDELEIFNFTPSLQSTSVIVHAGNYINTDSFQLVDYYISYGESPIDFEVVVDNRSTTTIKLKNDINFEGVLIYEVKFIDGSRSFFLGIGTSSDNYVQQLADMGYYNTSVCPTDYYTPINIVVD